jgi:hypothetical protein
MDGSAEILGAEGGYSNAEADTGMPKEPRGTNAGVFMLRCEPVAGLDMGAVEGGATKVGIVEDDVPKKLGPVVVLPNARLANVSNVFSGKGEVGRPGVLCNERVNKTEQK